MRLQILNIIIFLLILLWVYTAINKFIDFREFEGQLGVAAFSKKWATVMAFVIPLVELIAAALLVHPRTRSIGLIISALLMAVFTAYIALVLTGYYEKKPCHCGGVLKSMSWTVHLYFNIFFTLLAVAGTLLQRRLPPT